MKRIQNTDHDFLYIFKRYKVFGYDKSNYYVSHSLYTYKTKVSVIYDFIVFVYCYEGRNS